MCMTEKGVMVNKECSEQIKYSSFLDISVNFLFRNRGTWNSSNYQKQQHKKSLYQNSSHWSRCNNMVTRREAMMNGKTAVTRRPLDPSPLDPGSCLCSVQRFVSLLHFSDVQNLKQSTCGKEGIQLAPTLAGSHPLRTDSTLPVPVQWKQKH